MRLSIVIVALVGAVSVAGCSRLPKAKGPNKGLRVCEAHRANKALQGRRGLKEQRANRGLRVHKAHRANRVFQDRRGLKEQRANKVCPDRKAQRANKALRGHKGLKEQRANKPRRGQPVLVWPLGPQASARSGRIRVTPTAVVNSNAVPARSWLL